MVAESAPGELVARRAARQVVGREDAAAADQTFEMLMGNEVQPRKRFILTHASAVRNLDI
mgnify:CR=1 FL=1